MRQHLVADVGAGGSETAARRLADDLELAAVKYGASANCLLELLVARAVRVDALGHLILTERQAPSPDAEAIAQAEKIATHSFYSAPTAGQMAGLRALRDGQPWIDRARESYRLAGAAAAAQLGLPAPQGSTFLFVDAAAAIDERGIEGFLADCLEDGVAVAPGASCGRDYATWLRLCYTSAPPVEVAVAISKLAKRLTGC